jgi:hypothetical protein
MKYQCYVMGLALLMLTSLIVADGHANFCDLNTYVFYGNGMFNDQNVADKSLVELEDSLRDIGDLSEEEWSFELSYNHDEGAYSLFEVFRQRMGDQASSYWRWLGGLEIAPDWFQGAMQDVAGSYDLVEALIDADLRRHVQRYQGLLMEGNRVLVVAHSQGNLYANAAYEKLSSDGLPMDAFGIVSVATPASRVAGDGPYYTLLNDMVIGAVQIAFPNTLPGNAGNTSDDSDWTHHSFIDSYLKGNQSGPLIVNSVLSEANALSWPTPQVGKGPISVTLTWGEQPDFDLHIFEPGYSHVYYADPVGLYGYLDRDDANGYGPEHYYIDSCDQVEPGTYGVAVNYYRGSGLDTAQIQIQAGDVIRDFSVPMSFPMGSTGNFRSWPVASIEVMGDPESGYEFNVSGRN